MDDDAEIIAEFLVESHENLDQLDHDLVELERDPGSRELLSSVFRTIHTIKGTSGFLAFGRLERLAHVGENLLARLRDGQLRLDPEITGVLLRMVDTVRALLDAIERTGADTDEAVPAEAVAVDLEAVLGGTYAAAPAPAPVAVPEATPAPEPEPTPAPAPERADAVPADAADAPAGRGVVDSTVRVDVELLDSLMNLVGELVLTRNQMLQRAALRDDVDLQRTTHRLNLIAGELQEGVMKTRMQPIDNVWSKLPRVVRDLSVALGKSVDLRMEGRDTELDRTVLEAVRDPLTHLVRNSIDHGIEDVAARAAAGKPAQGTLTLRAFHEGGQVNIEITDDGAGIDPDRLRAKAVSRGMVTEEAAAAMSDREAVNLVFAAGFSTAAEVTNVSGRGVGMDVVKTNIERIGGGIDLVSEPGRGTTVRIRIPLTLAIIPALVVAAGENRYAIPQVNLLELVRLDPEQSRGAIEHVHGAPVYRLRGQLLPLVDLREQLGLPGSDDATTFLAVLQADNRHFGLVVDAVFDTEEIVVKPLGRQLRDIPVYAGATVMGDATIALILDCVALARRAGMAVEGGGADASSGSSVGSADLRSLLVVGLADGRQAAVPLESVDRLEQFPAARIERVGGSEVLQYRGRILPLVRLDRALHGVREGSEEVVQVVVCRTDLHSVGIVVTEILDIVEDELAVRSDLGSAGHEGSAVVTGRVTELVDIEAAVGELAPAARLAAGAA